MKCKKCSGRLEIRRTCGRVRMKCDTCGTEYHIHEVIAQLDQQTEEILEGYNVIIYD